MSKKPKPARRGPRRKDSFLYPARLQFSFNARTTGTLMIMVDQFWQGMSDIVCTKRHGGCSPLLLPVGWRSDYYGRARRAKNGRIIG